LEFVRENHLYQSDLDILGEGSLFELISTTRPDAPTIGLLLGETNNSALAEYALRDVAKPIGVICSRVWYGKSQ
jgi:hypothetical protein